MVCAVIETEGVPVIVSCLVPLLKLCASPVGKFGTVADVAPPATVKIISVIGSPSHKVGEIEPEVKLIS